MNYGEVSAADLAEANKLLSKGRMVLVQKAPYISTTALALVPKFINRPGMTCGVTPGLVLYINIVWFLADKELREGPPTSAKKPPNERARDGVATVAGILNHETQHVQRGLGRLQSLEDKDLANIAADLAINDQLIDAGWLLPSFVVRLHTYNFPKGKTLEWYYHELVKKKKAGELPKTDSCGCGGIAGNPVDKALEEELDAAIGRIPVEVEAIRYSTNKQIHDHITRNHGSAPGFNLEELEFKRKDVVVPWPRTLNHVLRRATGKVINGEDDCSYARMNRRAAGLRTLHPGHIAHQCLVLFVRDTSGSMSADDLNTAGNEMISCMQACGLDEVLCVDVDVEVHGVPKPVRVRDIPKLDAKGRGGTSFVKALAFIEKMPRKPDVVVYLTDGYGTAPPVPPKGFKVIWCLVPSSGSCARPAPWGEYVVCSNDPELRHTVGHQFVEDES